MNTRLKLLLSLPLLIIASYFGYWSYAYFFNDSQPTATLSGLQNDCWYQGDVSCSLSGSDSYKVSDISIWLDGKALVNNHKVLSKRFEHPFTIPTKSIGNGKHTLVIEVTNGTRAARKTRQELNFNVDNTPLQAAFVKQDVDHKVFQGRTLHLQFQVNKEIAQATVNTLSKKFICLPEAVGSPIYECFIPIPCEEIPNEYPLSVEILDHVGARRVLENKFQIVSYPFKKQVINVDPELVEAEKLAAASNKLLEEQLAQLLEKSPCRKLWQGSFCAPIDVKNISTDFGTVRTSQEKGRYIHTGLDVLNAPKSVVWAPQNGIVIIKDRYAYSGNTVVLDHGCGIFSLFFHLDSFADIALGQMLKKGDPLGKLGKTGYATGYHLHWELRVANTPVEPMEWTKPNF